MTIPRLDMRILAISKQALYHKESDLRALHEGIYNQKIGHGLFSSIAYSKDDVVCFFSGDLISPEESVQRQVKGEGGYSIKVNSHQYLDYYHHYKRGECIASYANSPFQVKLCHDRSIAIRSNINLVVDTRKKTASLKASKSISAHTEILYSYSNEYIYPTV